MAGFMIVGLPDTAVNEAKDRVRAAIKNSGCLFPYKRITVNLAPADLRKEGPAYDLPIAIGILMASGLFYVNYFCRFLNSGLPCFLLKLLVMVGLGSTIALDLHHIQNDGVMDDAIYGRQRGHRVFEDLVPLAKN